MTASCRRPPRGRAPCRSARRATRSPIGRGPKRPSPGASAVRGTQPRSARAPRAARSTNASPPTTRRRRRASPRRPPRPTGPPCGSASSSSSAAAPPPRGRRPPPGQTEPSECEPCVSVPSARADDASALAAAPVKIGPSFVFASEAPQATCGQWENNQPHPHLRYSDWGGLRVALGWPSRY